jgi:hypothetical protein
MSNEVMAAYFPVTKSDRFAENQIVDQLQAIRAGLAIQLGASIL